MAHSLLIWRQQSAIELWSSICSDLRQFIIESLFNQVVFHCCCFYSLHYPIIEVTRYFLFSFLLWMLAIISLLLVLFCVVFWSEINQCVQFVSWCYRRNGSYSGWITFFFVCLLNIQCAILGLKRNFQLTFYREVGWLIVPLFRTFWTKNSVSGWRTIPS